MAKRVLHDKFFKQAKAEGYLARSAYKLIEIDDRKRLLRAGDRVLDLGCAPGSWLQVTSARVGVKGVVVGIDLQPIEDVIGSNVRHTTADAFTIDPAVLIAEAGGMFDVVLSDMAPNTSGQGDHFLSVRLCRRVLEVAGKVLKRGGHLAMKVFEGEEYPALLREVGEVFGEAKGFKPEACRGASKEIYIVAKGFRGIGGNG